MIFNDKWSKEDNDLMREMIKNGKTHNQIIEFFGKEKVLNHPNKKFHKGKHININYDLYLNEIKINPKHTEFIYKFLPSLSYQGKNDIYIDFTLNNHEYVIILFYLFENDIQSYDILFTKKTQYIEYDNRLNEILKLPGNHLTDSEHEELKNILEDSTNYNEIYELMSSISYILIEIYDQLNISNNLTYSITETDNPGKIKMYKLSILQSFKDEGFSYKKRKTKVRNKIKDIYYYSKIF